MSGCVKKYLPLYVITLVVGGDDDDDAKTGEENSFQSLPQNLKSVRSGIFRWHLEAVSIFQSLNFGG